MKTVLFLLFPLFAIAESDEVKLHLTCNKVPVVGEECFELSTVEGSTLNLRKAPFIVLTDVNTNDVSLSTDKFGITSLDLKMDLKTAEILSEVSHKNIGKFLAIVVHDKVVAAPPIIEWMGAGSLNITEGKSGEFWDEIPWMRKRIEAKKTSLPVGPGRLFLIGLISAVLVGLVLKFGKKLFRR